MAITNNIQSFKTEINATSGEYTKVTFFNDNYGIWLPFVLVGMLGLVTTKLKGKEKVVGNPKAVKLGLEELKKHGRLNLYLDTNMLWNYFDDVVRKEKGKPTRGYGKKIEFILKHKDLFNLFVSNWVKAEVGRQLRSEWRVEKDVALELWDEFLETFNIKFIQKVTFEKEIDRITFEVELKKRVNNVLHLHIARTEGVFMLTGDDEIVEKCSQFYEKVMSYYDIREIIDRYLSRKSKENNHDRKVQRRNNDNKRQEGESHSADSDEDTGGVRGISETDSKESGAEAVERGKAQKGNVSPKSIVLILFSLLLVASLFSVYLAQATQSDQLKIEGESITEGGGTTESTNFELNSSIGGNLVFVGNSSALELCKGVLCYDPDLTVNQSSINENDTSISYNADVLFNITVWNIGPAAAANVRVSCYDNGTSFDSSVINAIPPDISQNSPRYTTCTRSAMTIGAHNISVIVDPDNTIVEQNGSNNEAWKLVNVGKAALTLNLLLNGTVGDRLYTYPEAVNATGFESNGGDADVTYTLFRDNVSVGTGSAVSENVLLGNGTYVYHYNSTGGQNWTSASISRVVYVNKGDVSVTLLINGTSADTAYFDTDDANFTVTSNVTGVTAKIASNFSGWIEPSGTISSGFENRTTLEFIKGRYNITGYVPTTANYTSASDTQILTIKVKLTLNVTNRTGHEYADTKYYVFKQGGSYTNFRFQKFYHIASQTKQFFDFNFTPSDDEEGRTLRIEVPTELGKLEVEMYNFTINRSVTVPARVIRGDDYTGQNPITGNLSYIFFINDSAIDYTTYNITLPFNTTAISSPNYFLRCEAFDWDNNLCTKWNATKVETIQQDARFKYVFDQGKTSFKCAVAAPQIGYASDSFRNLYSDVSGTFKALYFDDFEFGYNSWTQSQAINAYPFPSLSYTGDTSTGYSLKATYQGSGGTFFSDTGFTGIGAVGNFNTTHAAAKDDAKTALLNACTNSCGGGGTIAGDFKSEIDTENSTHVRYWAHAECLCGSPTPAAGYVVKDIPFNTSTYKYITFSYKLQNSSDARFDMEANVSGQPNWVKWNGTSTTGNFSIPGFPLNSTSLGQGDGLWHTATISLDRDLDALLGAGDHYIYAIRFGHSSGVPGTTFFIDDFIVTNELPGGSGGGASGVIYSSDFETVEVVDAWGRPGTNNVVDFNTNYTGVASMKVTCNDNTCRTDKVTDFFVSDYPIIEFSYRVPPTTKINFIVLYENTSASGTNAATIGIYNMSSNYGALGPNEKNLGKINNFVADNTWRRAFINLSEALDGSLKIKRVEFSAKGNAVSGDVFWVDTFGIMRGKPGECVGCTITAGGGFNTKYFAGLEGGYDGFASGSSIDRVNSTNAYLGLYALKVTNASGATGVTTIFQPGGSNVSFSSSSYPYLSFAYKTSDMGGLAVKINSVWYKIPNFNNSGLWNTVTLNLTGNGTVGYLEIGNTSASTGTFYIDEFAIQSNTIDACPFKNTKQDATFNLGFGMRIDAGGGEAKPDVDIPSVNVSIDPASPATGQAVNITFLVRNIGNASTGGGTDSIELTCRANGVNVSNNFVDVLGPAPPVNSSWSNCTWTPSTGGTYEFNISSVIIDPPGKEEWNWTNNNYSTTITVTQRYANVSWVTQNQTVDRGTLELVGRVLRNNTATAVENHPCTFLRNGTLIASNVLTNSTGHCATTWNTTTLAVGDYNVTVNITDNTTTYHNASPNANQASIFVALQGTLSVTVNNPANASSFDRGDTVTFNSTITDELSNVVNGASVNWYNATRLILSTQNGTFTIPAGHATGSQQFRVEAAGTFYNNGSTNISLAILNAQPQFVGPTTNVTGDEVEVPHDIRISCTVTDVETAAADLTVNVSIRDPNGVWSNESASRSGSTFRRDYNLNTTSPIGNYTTQCSALDGQGAINQSSTLQFLAFQNGTVEIVLNTTTPAWNEPVNISILARRDDLSAISSGSTTIRYDSTTACTGTTNVNGRYQCVFNAPNAVGDYVVTVEVTDPSTSKVISNTTSLNVTVAVGETKSEQTTARDVGCYDTPRLIQNPDGTISTVVVRVCVWR